MQLNKSELTNKSKVDYKSMYIKERAKVNFYETQEDFLLTLLDNIQGFIAVDTPPSLISELIEIELKKYKLMETIENTVTL